MPTTKKNARRPSRPADTYLDLIRAHPLRSIRTEDDAAEAGDVLTELLMSKPEDDRDPGERQYIDALSDLLGNYESKATFPNLPKTTPLGVLKFLMEESHLKVADVGRILGSQPNASEMLAGKRGISKSHILKLARHFKLSPAVFLAAD